MSHLYPLELSTLCRYRQTGSWAEPVGCLCMCMLMNKMQVRAVKEREYLRTILFLRGTYLDLRMMSGAEYVLHITEHEKKKKIYPEQCLWYKYSVRVVLGQ